MEWVETTGKTVEEAKDAALDQLGIHDDEAEFEVLEEPRPGLFGRLRGEARVRARVAPKAPPPKDDRRDRRRRSAKPEGGGGNRSGNGNRSGSKGGGGRDRKPAEPAGGNGGDGGARTGEGGGSSNRNRRRTPSGGGNQGGRSADDRTAAPRNQEGNEMSDDVVSVDTQADMVEEFLDGLLEAFGATGTLAKNKLDDETVEVAVDGDDLGLLIGPKGQTLTAIQDLSRTVLQRRATGRHEGRVRIDVSGYRQRRQEALARFTQQVADQVKESGVQKALEPMNAADRKVVHDTVNELDGVRTLSEGEEPRRRVVIVPADA